MNILHVDCNHFSLKKSTHQCLCNTNACLYGWCIFFLFESQYSHVSLSTCWKNTLKDYDCVWSSTICKRERKNPQKCCRHKIKVKRTHFCAVVCSPPKLPVEKGFVSYYTATLTLHSILKVRNQIVRKKQPVRWAYTLLQIRKKSKKNPPNYHFVESVLNVIKMIKMF